MTQPYKNKKWAYYAVHQEKNRKVLRDIERLVPPGGRIADLGCDDGALVTVLRRKGYDAEGLDLTHSSAHVKKHDLRKALPCRANRFDAILLLDAIQYLTTAEQQHLLDEIRRVLKPGGTLILTAPNQHHFFSRVIHFLTDIYLPTDAKTFPVGDKGYAAFLRLINRSLHVVRSEGLLPTNFILSTYLITKFPGAFGWLLRIIDALGSRKNSFLLYVVATKRGKHIAKRG